MSSKDCNPRSFCFPLPQKLPQQEGEEIREGVELAVEANVAVAQLDTVANIRITVALDEFHERLGAAVLQFHLHRNERASIPNEEVHLYRALLIAVIIQLIAGFHEHVADNILVDGTLVSTEVTVSSEVLLRFLIKRGYCSVLCIFTLTKKLLKLRKIMTINNLRKTLQNGIITVELRVYKSSQLPHLLLSALSANA